MSVRGQPVMSNPEEWKKWEGRVDGKFPLRQWLGGSEQSAVFLTERTGQPDPKVVIKLIVAEQDADRQLAHWRAAAQLSHPHLMRIYEAGRCRLDGTPLLYLVMEYAEEDLSQILPQRPLAPAEVTELLPALLDSLSYLHGKGFVHGRIKPSNVHAMGDELKLSADRIVSSAELNPKTQRRDVYDAPETAAKAQAAMEAAMPAMRAAILQYVDDMERAAGDSAKLFEAAHEIRGFAETAGMITTGRIAEVLCRYMDDLTRFNKPLDATIVALHVSAIARAARAEDDSVRTGQAVAAELAALVARRLSEGEQ